MNQTPDLYHTLGVKFGATAGQLRDAYRRLAMETHPDRHGGSTDRFNDVASAYRILSHPETRELYDQRILSQVWTHPIELTLEQVYHGCTVTILGASVAVPPGVTTGTPIDLAGHQMTIQVKPHGRFKRSGDDLLVDLSVDAIQAALGCDVELEHISTAVLKFKLPQGIDQGAVVKIGGRGMRKAGGQQCGDLLVRITVTTPKNLTPDQLSLLRDMFEYKETIQVWDTDDKS